MIIEIHKDNINKLDNSFIDKEAIINELNNNSFAKVLIYSENNIVKGYLYYSDIYDRIEINQITIFDKYKRQGYASKLIEYLIAKNKNISLEVKCDNVPAIKLYEKYGFKKVAERKGYYNGIDGNLMILEMK